MYSRYSRWDGSQDPLGEHVDLGEILEQLGDDLLMGAGGNEALRRVLREGIPGRVPGLDALRRRLAAARERLRERLSLDGPLADVQDRLDEIIATERRALAESEDDGARFAELRLDALPPDPAGAIRELQDYDFAAPEAELAFRELLDELRREILDSYFTQLSAGMQDVTPDDIARTNEMLADLNDMIEARERGEDPRFDEFMDRHGDLFPENPRDLDELLEALGRRMAAMSRMLAAMTPEQRRQLQELANTLMNDLDFAFQMSLLQDNLRALMPSLPWDEPAPGGLGDEPLPMSDTIDALERLGELEELDAALEGDYPGARLDDVDEEALRDALGDDAAIDLARLRQIERALEESGVLRRSDGQLELTPRGARLLGERALTRLLDRIRRETATRAAGPESEPSGQTRPWRFGDREPISVQRTVYNSVVRTASTRSAGRGADHGVGLRPGDFEVTEMEVRPRTATVLLLDLSFSMPLRGHFVPAKRMALALHALIEGKYTQDSLYLVGFSDYARRMQPAELGAEGFERVYGTNMHHAFLLARRLLSRDPRPVKQVIMVTDGEPTAHLEGERSCFSWPPVSKTITTTLKEAMRLSRAGISLHVFLLEDEPGLVAFADRLARVTGGQVFQTAGDDVGRFVVRDYLGGRRGASGAPGPSAPRT